MGNGMKYLSVCSGIEAATVAWKPLGWEAFAFSEIEKFPSAVLKYHYPDTPNLGDMTNYKEWPDANINVLVGGTPCQAFSVAGLRKGLSDPRGNLALVYLGIAERYRPDWMVWENVPGVLSSNGGEDFRSFLSGCAGWDIPIPEGGWQNSGIITNAPGSYGLVWRVLDAQYFGVAQRRRRVFVVGYLGDWRPAYAVLFEQESLCGHPPPSRQTGKGSSQGFEVGPGAGGFTDLSPTLDARCKDGPIRNQLGCGVAVGVDGSDEVGHALTASKTATGRLDPDGQTFVAQVAPTLQHNGKAAGSATQQDAETGALVAHTLLGKASSSHDDTMETYVTHTLRGEGYDASEDGSGRGTPLVPVTAIHPHCIGRSPDAGPQGKEYLEDGSAYTMDSRGVPQAVAFDTTQVTSSENRSNPKPGDPCHPLSANAHPPAIAFSCKDDGRDCTDDLAPTMRSMNSADSNQNAGGQLAVAVSLRGRDGRATAELGGEISPSIRTGGGGGDKPHVLTACDVADTLSVGANQTIGRPGDICSVGEMAVRRLTPRECERLQGFPDNYTLIPAYAKRVLEDVEKETMAYIMAMNLGMTEEDARRWASHPDGPRYKALGNSFAVPVVSWIGKRIQMVQDIIDGQD